MKIYTQNLHGYADANKQHQLVLIADFIASNDIDVVSLQEVSQFKYDEIEFDNLKKSNTALILKKILKDKYNLEYNLSCIIFKESFVSYEEGLAVLSKSTINDSQMMRISNCDDFSDWHTRFAQSIIIDDFQLINSHYTWDEGVETFLEQFNRAMSMKKSDHIILTGDFNVERYSDNYQKVIESGFYDLVSSHSKELALTNTFLDEGPCLIDFVFSNQDLKVNFGEIIFQDKEVSDHAGVYVEVVK